MSDFLHPFRFPRTDGDVLSIEEIAPAPFLVDRDPGAVASVNFPVKGEGQPFDAETESGVAGSASEFTAASDLPSESGSAAGAGVDEKDSVETPVGDAIASGESISSSEADAVTESASDAELENAKASLIGAVNDLVNARQEFIERVEEDVVDLAVEIAQVLVGEAVEREPCVHRVLAQCAIEQLGDVDSVRLRASPAAHEVLQSMVGEGASTQGVSVTLVRDEGLGSTDYIVDAVATEVDGRVSSRLESVRVALKRALAESQGEADHQGEDGAP